MKKELQKGDVLSCISNGTLAKLIQKFTKSRINHSAYVIEIWNELFIIDSQRDGTNLRPIKEWERMYSYEYRVHRRVELSKEEYQRQAEKAISKSGNTPYDFKSLLWYQPRYQIFGKWKGKKDEEAEGRMYCSEFVAWVLGMENWWELSPAELYISLSKDDNYITF